MATCPMCGGTGRSGNSPCWYCNGYGWTAGNPDSPGAGGGNNAGCGVVFLAILFGLVYLVGDVLGVEIAPDAAPLMILLAWVVTFIIAGVVMWLAKQIPQSVKNGCAVIISIAIILGVVYACQSLQAPRL